MSKIVVACDLDNTLIHSYKHITSADVCVEYIKGKQQSFMSDSALLLLKAVQERTMFVPLTTRSLEQYKRIVWEKPMAYAMTTHGGVLLHKDRIDKEWVKHVQEMTFDSVEMLMYAQQLLLKDGACNKVRIVDNTYVFAWSNEPIQTKMQIDKKLDFRLVTTTIQGNKVYVFPMGLSKGTALSRFQQRFRPSYLICVGDNAMDIDMLNLADLAIVPCFQLADKLKCRNIVVYDQKRPTFADFVLEQILKADIDGLHN